MIVERLTTLEQLAGLAPEWRALQASTTFPLPFNTADWALCWWKHLREKQLTVRDRQFTLAVRAEDRSLVGVAPLMITERPGVGLLRARCLQFIGADPNITEVRTLLARPDAEEAVYRAVSEQVMLASSEWDWMQWTGVHAAGPGRAVLGERGLDWTEPLSCWVLPLAPTWEEFRGGLSRNIKESLRKCVNAPKRDGIELRFQVARQPEEVTAALTRFFELHAERAGLEGTIRHPDVFRDPPAREFLRDYCALGAARGEVHVFCLKVGEEVIAVRIGFRSGDSMYLYYSGYDTKYAKYSVMTHCLAEALRWSIEAGVKEVNLSIGTDVSKTRWSPQQHLFHSGKLLSPNLRGRAVHGAYQWLSQRLRDERIRGLSRVFGRRRG